MGPKCVSRTAKVRRTQCTFFARVCRGAQKVAEAYFFADQVFLIPSLLTPFATPSAYCATVKNTHDEQDNAVAPQPRTARLVGFKHINPHHDVDDDHRNNSAAR